MLRDALLDLQLSSERCVGAKKPKSTTCIVRPWLRNSACDRSDIDGGRALLLLLLLLLNPMISIIA